MTGQPGTHGGGSEAALLWWRELALPSNTHPCSALDTFSFHGWWGGAPHPMNGLRGAQGFLDDLIWGPGTGPRVCFHL